MSIHQLCLFLSCLHHPRMRVCGSSQAQGELGSWGPPMRLGLCTLQSHQAAAVAGRTGVGFEVKGREDGAILGLA